MTVPTKVPPTGDVMESLLLKGDLAKLTPEERVQYYQAVCKSIGLNPLTKPFEYITLNGKLQLYALRACTDQLRKINNISLEIVSRDVHDDILTVHVRAKNGDGRVDEDLGSVAFPETLRGEARANTELKAVTKAKRRATLSICGWGWRAEPEVVDIPVGPRQPPKPGPDVITREPHDLTAQTPHDPQTGEVLPPESPIIPPQQAKFGSGDRPDFGIDVRDQAREAAKRGALVIKKFYNAQTAEDKVRINEIKAELDLLVDDFDRGLSEEGS